MHHLTPELIYPSRGPSPTPASSTSIPTASHLTSFPLTALPFELRLLIWQNTLPRTRILKIAFSPTHRTYIANTPPPPALAINHESRAFVLATHTYLHLSSPSPTDPLIPYAPPTDTLYNSSPAPLFSAHLQGLLWDLGSGPSRHAIRLIAFDLRVWNECCEAGLLGVLGRMRGLERVAIVVEFGREFRGERGFLEAPEWRGDLRGLAERAGGLLQQERQRACGFGVKRGKLGEVDVRCVLLTQGGEQA